MGGDDFEVCVWGVGGQLSRVSDVYIFQTGGGGGGGALSLVSFICIRISSLKSYFIKVLGAKLGCKFGCWNPRGSKSHYSATQAKSKDHNHEFLKKIQLLIMTRTRVCVLQENLHSCLSDIYIYTHIMIYIHVLCYYYYYGQFPFSLALHIVAMMHWPTSGAVKLESVMDTIVHLGQITSCHHV